MLFPPLYRVEQQWDQPQVADPAAEIRRQVRGSRLPGKLKPGAKVAVAVGSRGITNLALMTRAAVDTLKELRADPFVVAAMGSHGGATAQGQRELLASYGVTSEAMGVPVCTDMDVVELGLNSWGDTVYWDKNAYQADAVVTLSRVKPHTDFHGRYESGIVKMLVIGLGKRAGAAQHHKYGVPGLRDAIPESARIIVAKTPFALGLAILENARDQTARIQAVEPEALFDVEPRLLEEARRLMPRIPFRELDLLVVGELGKNYSGTGMDVNVLGRQLVEGEPDSHDPKITRIVVLDVSAESHGNAVGVGLADLTTQKLLRSMDEEITNINLLTSCFMLRARVPIGLATDRECVETGLKTCWQPRPERVRLTVIPNTLELARLWVSAPLAEQARGMPGLTVAEGPCDWPFDAAGNLRQEALFPECVRARRKRDRARGTRD